MGKRKDKHPMQERLDALNEPLNEKYTNDVSELNKYFFEIVQDHFKKLLPKVVFWEHSQKYILQSETLFSQLLNKPDFNDISRPLVNVFRIGLGINTIDALKLKI